MVHRDAAAGTNRLDAAQQALEAQTAAREQAERRLLAAQETIRELQTQLAHARLAGDEAVQRAAEVKQASDQALAALRAELLETQAGLRQTQQRLPAGRPAEDPQAARAKPVQPTMTGVAGLGRPPRPSTPASAAAGPAAQGPAGGGCGLRRVVEAGLAGAALAGPDRVDEHARYTSGLVV